MGKINISFGVMEKANRRSETNNPTQAAESRAAALPLFRCLRETGI